MSIDNAIGAFNRQNPGVYAQRCVVFRRGPGNIYRKDGFVISDARRDAGRGVSTFGLDWDWVIRDWARTGPRGQA